MTGRLYAVLGVLMMTGMSALSLGGPVFYLISWVLMLMVVYSVVSVLLARQLTHITQGMDSLQVERGGKVLLQVGLLTKSPLPTGPVRLMLCLPDGKSDVQLYPGFMGEKQAGFSLLFNHVGVWPCGAQTMRFSDIFGLLSIKKTLRAPLPQMLVLPRGFEVQPMPFAQMDDGRALPGRTGEDVTSPEDTRPYRQGDPFKRIHWKLSSRTRELVVRRFEVPAPPDTLILMDCTDPVGGEDKQDGTLRLRDTLCETALAVAAMQMAGEHPVRLPLYGATQTEFQSDRRGSLHLLKEELAYQLFRGGEPFERVLNLELRRMRRTGATVVITTRLDASIVEGVSNIRASGPNVRFYLITFDAGHERYLPYIQRLQQHLVEVNYVTPA
ncbi:MAG: DUF58 domain-containing protein [Clostridiales bacterium]|nr:DUF58 domain-containing protein [Clostridiales bacterium]